MAFADREQATGKMVDLKLRWGILGPGSITETFADALADSKHGELVAIGTRSRGKSGLSDRFPGVDVHLTVDQLRWLEGTHTP